MTIDEQVGAGHRIPFRQDHADAETHEQDIECNDPSDGGPAPLSQGPW